MLKFQTPMSNDEVCRAMTDKHTNKKTYILSKNWGNLFFTAKFFIFYFYFSNSLNVKKAVSNNIFHLSPIYMFFNMYTLSSLEGAHLHRLRFSKCYLELNASDCVGGQCRDHEVEVTLFPEPQKVKLRRALLIGHVTYFGSGDWQQTTVESRVSVSWL